MERTYQMELANPSVLNGTGLVRLTVLSDWYWKPIPFGSI